MTVLDDLQAPPENLIPDKVVVYIPDEWVVVFEPQTSIWWNRFLTPGFGHCLAFAWTPRGYVYVEPLVTGTGVGMITDEAVLGYFTLSKLGRVKLLRAKRQAVVAKRPRIIVTCAGCIGSILGLRRLPLTPHGLFWMLRRLGAVEVGRDIDG